MQNNSPQWSSGYIFLLASIGSTVGLSNIWKFTYLAGENGGGAFVLVYLVSLLVMGIPILAAELLIGRRGGESMVGTLTKLSTTDGISASWKYFGWAAMICVFLVLSFYCVIAGMTMDYTLVTLFGGLADMDAAGATQHYEHLLASPLRMIISQGAFIALNIWIVGRGVQAGLERSVGWMTPALFIILVLLMVYAIFTANFGAALTFLFAPDFSRITPSVVLAAFGQAFFSLGIGVGVMMTYGAYMSRSLPILRSAAIISFSDGLASVLAGLCIFPVVFQYNLSPAEGPGLIFLTLPIAFGKMIGGSWVGATFFLLLFFAALTSSISLLESIVAHLIRNNPANRLKITVVTCVALWVVGWASVFSFNIWKDITPLDFLPPVKGKTFYELIDYFASNILMPLGGILMALMAGWLLKPSTVHEEMNLRDEWMFRTWKFLVRFVAPAAVLLIFVSNL